jgi:D-arabinan endo alpha-(1,5)-arabinofuranosidase
MKRRTFLASIAAAGVGAAVVPGLIAPTGAQAATWKKRVTGADLDTNSRWQVAGTDLGIPYVLENGSIGYLFGDTFNTPWPEQPNNDWRSPVMLRSAVHPGAAGGIVFDSAAKVAGNGRAPEIMRNGHNGIGIDGLWEVTVIPNDGISFPETGRQLVSYMSIENWNSAGPNGPQWKSRYAGLAYSDNGNDFVRTNLKWFNSGDNLDPFQMWTMQRAGDWVYVFSVRSGRQDGPMMLRRVPWERMFSPEAYEGWGWNGSNWGWGRPCSPILNGRFGEPSVRRLEDGTWAMAYLNCATGNIVTRTATGPDQVWTNEKIQITFAQEPALYGGFIHPWSTKAANGLHLMVSKWTHAPNGASTAYHVSQYVGSL